MNKRFNSPAFRKAFVAANVRRGIAYQLRAMRGTRTQGQIGELLSKPQNVVSRLEDPKYGKVTVQTLLDVAAAYDVALLVKFVSYGRLEAEVQDLSQEALVPLSWNAEVKVRSALERPFPMWVREQARSTSIESILPRGEIKQHGPIDLKIQLAAQPRVH